MVRQTPALLELAHRPTLLAAALAMGAAALLIAGIWHLVMAAWIKAAVACVTGIAVAGPAIWFGTERVSVSFDAAVGTCTIDTRRLTGAQFETFDLGTIKEAALETHRAPGHGAGAHRVVLVLAQGTSEDRRPLTPGYSGGRVAQDLAARINTWLAARPA